MKKTSKPPRRNPHTDVLRTRKAGAHRKRSEKRQSQKLRREIEQG